MAAPDNVAKAQAMAAAGAKPPKVLEARIPMPLGGLFTRSLDGWSVDRRWLDDIALNADRALMEEGGGPDLQLFDRLLDDDVAMSAFQQRRLDVISRDWEVEPGAEDAQSKAAADHLRDQLKSIRWDEICDKMLFTCWFGYGVGEAIWEIGKDGLLRLANVYVPDRGWFAFTNGGELRLRTVERAEGEPVPERKFWVMRHGGNNDAQHYGVGLAHWAYWPIYFKKNTIKFWALFLEKFGMPTMAGKFPQGWENDEEKLNALLASLAAIGTDSAVVYPEGVEVAPMEGTRSSSGASSYDDFIERMDTALTRIILTQTMTSTVQAAGMGSKQAEVHQDKGLAVAQADSDLLHESFNNSIARWLTEWNFPGAAIPRVYRKLEDDEDIDAIADRDTKLEALGWVRTEESFREVYGEGYERKPEPEPPLALPGVGAMRPGVRGQLPKPANDDRQQQAMAFAAQFAAHDPRPLYVQRKVTKGGQALLDWAAGQGFTDLQPVSELHVTVLYSRTPVDWFALASKAAWTPETIKVPKGGPRAAEQLGDKGAVVLHVAVPELEWRHRDLVEGGASHDFPHYWPHVTFAKGVPDGADLEAMVPFQGELEFGPEIWEALDDDGALELTTPVVEFAAEQLDAIDRVTAALAASGDKAVLAFVAPVREALQGLGPDADPQALRVACLQALEALPTDKFAMVLADPLFAVRAAEETGEGADAVA